MYFRSYHKIPTPAKMQQELCSSCVKLGSAERDADHSPGAGTNEQNAQNATAKSKTEGSAVDEEMDMEDAAPDGGWGWVVAWASFVTWVLAEIIDLNFGMLFSGILLEMGTSTIFISWIYSAGLVISCIIGIFAGPMVGVFGWRKVAMVMAVVNSLAVIISAFATTDVFLFFTSLAAGSTVGSQLIITNSIICQYFTRRRDIANTIMILGSSVNMVVIPYLLTYLHAEYGFKGAILITGGACLNQIPASMVFHPVEWHSRNPPHCRTQEPDDKPDHLRVMLHAFKSNLLLLKSSRVIVIALPHAVYFTAVVFTSSYIPFVMQTTGYTLEESAYCLTMVGIFHILARVIHPCLSFAFGVSNFLIMAAGYGGLPIALVGFICGMDLHVKAASMAVFGIAMSFVGASIGPVITDTLGASMVLRVLSVKGLFDATGFLIIGPLTGMVKDLSGSYTSSLYVPAACMFFLSFLPFICMPAAKTHDRRREQQSSQMKAKKEEMELKKQSRPVKCFKETSYLLSRSCSTPAYERRQLS
ncbi:monocarboxylate transporter 13-like isoform X2 [Scylla paramamosain]|uniref:monocarboxylate transporter 13-like isoform X2 n=1 Tax=Scylla paramamosain TaxID=85552 RepID=UPI00308331EA